LVSLCRSIALRRVKERFADYRARAEANEARLEHDKYLLENRLEVMGDHVDMLEDVIARDRARVIAETAKYEQQRDKPG
jgi:hypothetical protein